MHRWDLYISYVPKINQSQGQDMLVGIEQFGTLVGDYLRQQNNSEIEIIDENIGKDIWSIYIYGQLIMMLHTLPPQQCL